MGITVDIARNEFLLEVRKRTMAQVLQQLLEEKFGSLPRWAAERLDNATPVQLDRWVKKVLTAGTLEGVIGRTLAQPQFIPYQLA